MAEEDAKTKAERLQAEEIMCIPTALANSSMRDMLGLDWMPDSNYLSQLRECIAEAEAKYNSTLPTKPNNKEQIKR